MVTSQIADAAESTLDETLNQAAAAAPRAVSGVVFLALAYVAIKTACGLLSRVVRRTHPQEERLVADLTVVVAGAFMWFGAALAFLHVVGMTQIAASLGTATGFIALGVAYAMSDAIADTVSGVYLLKDPDFEQGDRVEVDGTTGTVKAVDLRKTRLEDEEGDTVVVANSDVDEGWTLHSRSHS